MPADSGLVHDVYDPGRSWLPLTRIPLPHKPEAAPRARRHAREVLALRRVDAELTATVELVVSELVTNAVRHGVCLCGCTRGPVSLSILRTEDRTADRTDIRTDIRMDCRMRNRLRVEVADPSRTPPRWPIGTGPAGTDMADPEEGRGLLLVTALAADWGDHAGPVRGKVVWCEFLAR
ncbi:ATP-binding protein [Streptomyces odonnellii]|uniref:ATP-binding protein n=1 Tax=Streptomyces odonnellii TaxID=1417980 RepID=UPI00099C02EA|nr:ATP-binding protein [Streptomyces odonnellii]